MERPLMIIGAGEAAEQVTAHLEAEGYPVVSSTPAGVVSDLARLRPRVLVFELADDVDQAQSVIQRIQATSHGAAMPVVFFGPPPGPNPAEVVMIGGDLFLPAPVDDRSLLESIHRLCGPPPEPAAEPPLPEVDTRAVTRARQKGSPVRRLPTMSLIKATGLAVPTPLPKRPEPGGTSDLEDLSRPTGLPSPWDIPRFPERSPDSGAGLKPRESALLKQAIDADLMLDPREMALTITTMVPEMHEDDDLPPAEEVTAAPQTEVHTRAATRPAASPIDEVSEVDAIVQEFMVPGGDGDTVAVRIRRTIDAFEERMDAAELSPSTDGLTQPPPPVQPRSSRPLPRAEGDEIDLEALNVDATAGAYDADPERVLEQLEDELSGAAPMAQAPHQPVVSPDGTEVSHPGRLPPEPIPSDWATGSVSHPRESASELDSEGAAAPPPPRGDSDARDEGTPVEISAHGTMADAGAPLASPYDLPPVVSAQGFEVAPRRPDRRDVVDTVPGRRTAVHLERGDGGISAPPESLSDEHLIEVTQPAKGLGNQRDGAVDAELPRPEPGAGRPDGGDSAASAEPQEVPVRLREGTLAELDPASLLQSIAFHKLDGRLEITADDSRFELFFAGGIPRLAQSSRPDDRMLAMLRRRGRITAEQQRECEGEVTAGRRAGAVLLDRGWIRPSELIPTVRAHLQDLVYAIFGLERGRYLFDADAPLPDEIVYLDQRPSALLLEGVRRKYTPERIVGLAGSEHIIPVKPPDADETLLAGAELSGRDWRIIDAMDGRAEVTDLAEHLGAPVGDVWALAWGLACLGLVKLQHRVGASVVRHRPTERQLLPPGLDDPAPSDRPLPDFDGDVERVMNRHALVREGDYFACLGVAPDASPHELRRAYDELRGQFAADVVHPRVSQDFATELSDIREVLDEAYSVLADDVLRASYCEHVTRSAASSEEP